MKTIVRLAVMLVAGVGALLLAESRASAAAPLCQIVQTSLPNPFSNFNVFTAPTTYTESGTFQFECENLTDKHVMVFVSGSQSGGYISPSIIGPNNFALKFNLCVPGAGSCSGSGGNVWNLTNGFTLSTATTGSSTFTVYTFPSFSVFVPGTQDAPVGSYGGTLSTANLWFSFKCGTGGSAVSC
jgi:hypothetical protein